LLFCTWQERSVTSTVKIPLGPFPQTVVVHSHTTDASAGDNPHFAAIGGVPAIVRLVERLYWHMDTRPEAAGIRALHPRDLSMVKDVLVTYLTQWLGGPQQYSVERGQPRLRHRHMPFQIREAERDAWMLCMRDALAEVVPDAVLRAQLDAAFLRVADAIVNAEERTVHLHK
jgi:hemoglobin